METRIDSRTTVKAGTRSRGREESCKKGGRYDKARTKKKDAGSRVGSTEIEHGRASFLRRDREGPQKGTALTARSRVHARVCGRAKICNYTPQKESGETGQTTS